jgi:taurine transport system substrate-binding protein
MLTIVGVTIIMTRMSPADTTPEAGKKQPLPVYKRRRRRRIYTAVAVVVLVAAGVGGYAAAQGGGSTTEPNFTISTSTGSVADSDSIIATNSSVAATVPAHLHFIPFEAGVTAIAEMRSGSVQSISGVGNPPTTEAIGEGTGITVVLVQSFDADQLLVPASVTTASQLSGKSIGVLVGSSEDYELRGWLRLQGLTSSVKLVEMDSEQAVAAAYVSHAIDAAYVYGSYATEVEGTGGHAITDAEQIAKEGVAGIDVVAVSSSLVNSDPSLIQKYVCAEVTATRDLTGAGSAKYLAQSASFQGITSVSQIIAATKAYPFIPLSQQLHWLGSTPGDTSSRLVQAYAQTGQFLVQQGRLTTAPTAAEIAGHVDPTFVKNALNGDC